MKPWTLLAVCGGWLNILDALLTMRAVEHQIATEGNPLLAVLISSSVPLFYLLKFGVVVLFIFLASHASRNRFARGGIAAGVAAYVGIATYHIVGILA
jgi:hypothetical protein